MGELKQFNKYTNKITADDIMGLTDEEFTLSNEKCSEETCSCKPLNISKPTYNT